MAKASTAQASTEALGFRGTPLRFTIAGPPPKRQVPFVIGSGPCVLQSACCLSQRPLVESVSLTSGVNAFTYDSLPWTMGASEFVHPLQLPPLKVAPSRQALADVGSPLNANGANGVIT